MTAKIKVLITIDWFLPGTNSGGPVRSYANLIEHLDEGFEFYIVTRNNDFGSKDTYLNITPNIWTRFNDYTSVFYCSPEFLNKTNLRELFTNTPFDVAYINGIYSWYFSILPVVLLKKLNRPILVSARGMLNPQAFSVKPTKKRAFLKLATFLQLYKDITFHATNKDEAHHIKALISNATNVSIAPNLPRKIKGSVKTESNKHKPVRFVNLARISIEKGTLIMLNAVSQITHPLVLDLYGPIYDEEYWTKCQEVISNLPSQIQVNYMGIVESENVPTLLSTYDYFVLLSEGENFGHAILEALSVGLPVIISDKTPWRNLSKKSVGWDINIHQEAEVIEAFHTALEMSEEIYKIWSLSAFAFAKENMENPKVLEQNKALFLNV